METYPDDEPSLGGLGWLQKYTDFTGDYEREQERQKEVARRCGEVAMWFWWQDYNQQQADFWQWFNDMQNKKG